MIIQITKGAVVGLAVVALTGCATGPTANPQDPLEPFNRKMFAFNEAVDHAVAKPAATAYKIIMPSWTQTGITNFFGNLEDAWSAANNLLQGRGIYASQNFSRVFVNSTIGIFGLLDIATFLKIERHPTNFSITLGRWGVGSGPYVMLPLLGPATLRDFAALPIDSQGDLYVYLNSDTAQNFGLGVLNIVNTRARYLGDDDFLASIALDKYSFIRDSYIQRQDNLIAEGKTSVKGGVNDLSETIAPFSTWFKMKSSPSISGP